MAIFSQLRENQKKSQTTALSIQEMHIAVGLWSAVVCLACVILISNISVCKGA